MRGRWARRIFLRFKISSPTRQRASHRCLKRLFDRERTHDGLAREVP